MNETDLRYVRQGQPVSVSIDALGERELKGRVIEIGLFGRAQFTQGENYDLRSLLQERIAAPARRAARLSQGNCDLRGLLQERFR